jgi:hypothetical protein
MFSIEIYVSLLGGKPLSVVASESYEQLVGVSAIEAPFPLFHEAKTLVEFPRFVIPQNEEIYPL